MCEATIINNLMFCRLWFVMFLTVSILFRENKLASNYIFIFYFIVLYFVLMIFVDQKSVL